MGEPAFVDADVVADTFAISQAMVDRLAAVKAELFSRAAARGHAQEALALCDDQRRRFWVEANDERVSDIWECGFEWENGAPSFFIRATHHGPQLCWATACGACRRALLPKELR